MDYHEFLASKTDLGTGYGFEPIEIPDFLKGFQKPLTAWAIKRGRGSLYEHYGLGKTIQELVWADNVVRHTNKPVLILTPLAVSPQTIREAVKFGIDAEQSRNGKFGKRIVVTNYERMHYFSPSDFGGVVCDESSCIKDADSKTKAAIGEFMRTIAYRLLCTATPAPNDYIELGTSAEVLGEMGYQDMLTKFFKKDQKGGHHGWARAKYYLKGHAEHAFWRWVCSWARSCRKPSDLGFDDDGYILPELVNREHVIVARTKRDGFLLDLPARTLDEQREERRRTINERCEKVAELVAEQDGCSICWGFLNDECDLLEKIIPGSVQVAGKDSEEWKEMVIRWFVGEICICQLTKKNASVKLAECGNLSTKKIDSGSAKLIPNTKSGSASNDRGRLKRTANTCVPTTQPINTDGKSELKSNRTPTTQPGEKNTNTTKNTENNKKTRSRNGRSLTPKNDSLSECVITESQQKNTTEFSPNKTESVQSAEGVTPEIEDTKDSVLTIVTQPEESEDYSVPHVISGSENLTTESNCLSKRSCTCGHTTGKRVLISKPEIFGFGLNLQCCHHMTFFPSHSWEQVDQAIHRCHRFGQISRVIVDMVASEGEAGILANLQRKSEQADVMFEQLVLLMNDHLSIKRTNPFTDQAQVPPWLCDHANGSNGHIQEVLP